MPARSAVLGLPPQVRDDLNARLIGSGFGGYEDLATWLAEAGYRISKSALHRYGARLEAEFEGAMADARRAAELGRALVGDDDGSGLRSASTAIAQETLLRILMGLRQSEAAADGEDGPDHAALAKSLSLVTRAMADLGRLGLADAKYAAEQVRAAIAEAAARAETAARTGGVSAEGIAALRQAIMGAQ